VRIDVHAHYVTQDFIERVAGIGATTTGAARAAGAHATLDQRIDMMRGCGVDVQVLSVAGNQPYGQDRAASVAVARYLNDAYKQVVDGHGGHFSAFGCVPLPHTDAAIAEAIRCLDELGFAGITLGCSIRGRPLDDPEFEPFWAELNRRQTVVFFHPVGIGAPMTDAFGLDWKIAPTFEDSVTAVRLVLSGLTSRCPSVKIIIPHLGGTLPFIWGRLGAQAGDFGPDSELRAGLRKLYYDTVNRAPGMLCAGCAVLGYERVMLGTDFPYVPLPDYRGYVTAVEESGLPADQIKAILDQNAQALLNLPVPQR
jgi:predicted TIM-barrel fold metal-dependent hydrolase